MDREDIKTCEHCHFYLQYVVDMESLNECSIMRRNLGKEGFCSLYVDSNKEETK